MDSLNDLLYFTAELSSFFLNYLTIQGVTEVDISLQNLHTLGATTTKYLWS